MYCWLMRLMISIAADSDGRVGRMTSRHVARCAGCRQFHQSCRLLDLGLRSQANAWQHASGRSIVNAEFGVRSVEWAALDRGEFRIPHSALRTRHILIRAAAVVAACLAIATMTLLLPRRQSTESPAPPPRTASPAIWTGIDVPTAWIGFLERPLTTEVHSLARDTESGIRFLVACLNVGLPGDPPAHPEEPLLQ